MAAPHVSGAAALLLQRHPGWSPAQVQVGARCRRPAPRLGRHRAHEGGAGPARGRRPGRRRGRRRPEALHRARRRSRSADLNVNARPAAQALLLSRHRRGRRRRHLDGRAAARRPQPAGATIDVPALGHARAGRDASTCRSSRAPSRDAPAGDDYGFIAAAPRRRPSRSPVRLLRQRPRLESAPVVHAPGAPARRHAPGARAPSAYRFPAAPFGPPPTTSGAPLRRGRRRARSTVRPRASPRRTWASAVVVRDRHARSIDPWFLGSLDENDVQGYAGTPVNVNGLTLRLPLDIGAAAIDFPRAGTYYVAVDSGRDRFTGPPLRGAVRPPLLGERRHAAARQRCSPTTVVSPGRPTIAVRHARPRRRASTRSRS